ncbi:unnamed protein product [Urochloa humidicola]
MEESNFLTKYGSQVYIIHRRNTFRASKIMQARALENPKIKIIWDSEVVQAYGGEGGDPLAGVKVKNLVSGEVTDLQVAGLFFAIGYEPATKFRWICGNQAWLYSHQYEGGLRCWRRTGQEVSPGHYCCWIRILQQLARVVEELEKEQQSAAVGNGSRQAMAMTHDRTFK